MAMSHVCMVCGQDNARVSARLDPVYGLPTVVCVRCGGRSVRRRHPIIAAWRRFKRLDLALSALTLQAIFGAACVVGVVFAMNLLGHAAVDAGLTGRGALLEAARLLAGTAGSSRLDDDMFAMALALTVNAALSGVWITATLGHTRVLRRWAVFGLLLTGGAAVEALAWCVARPVAALLLDLPLAFPGLTRQEFVVRLELMAYALLVMGLAAPVGLGVRVLLRWAVGALWRRQLRVARLARRGTRA